MRLIRPVSAAVAALAVAAGLTAPAAAQSSSGLGTSLSSTKVLTAQLGQDGSILYLALLTDEAQSTLDSAVATPGAYSRVSLGKVASSLVQTAAVNQQLPSFEAKNTGPTSVDIANAPLPLALPVLEGNVAAGKLTATLAGGVAESGLDVGVANVKDAVGGLLQVASAKSTLAAKSASDSSTASRSANVTDITVLDLGAVLQGLGVDLGSLSLTQVAQLVDSLGAQTGLALPSGQSTLEGALAALNTAIDDLQASVAGTPATVGTITGAIDSTTSTLLGAVGVTSPLPTSTTATVTDAVTLVNAVVNDLQAEIKQLVSDGVKALDGLALLRLEGVEVGVATKAVQDVAASTATVTGKVGKVSVGNLTLPVNLDLVAAADQLNASIASVNSKVGEILGKVHPDLASLVKVSVLDKATEVTTKNGYTTASAGVTALTATITPPATLAAILSSVNALAADVLEVADVLGVALDQVPATLGLSTSMNTLRSTLSLGFGALSQPASVRVAQVLAASNYRAAATTVAAPPGSSPTLPRTGGDAVLLTAGVAIILGLVARRLLLTAAPKPIRIRRK